MTFFKRIISDKSDKSGLINMLLKPVSMLLSLVYTPLLLSYLGDEKYGLWATILSIISWINYCDVGIGHGLRNLLTKELTQERYEDAKKSVSTAYIVLTGIAVLVLLVLIVLTFVLNWHDIFKTDIDMTPTLLISFIFIVINFILALCNTLSYALQLSEMVAIRSCLVQVANIVGLILLQQFTESSLVWIAILFGLTSCILYIENSARIFLKHKYLRPSFKFFDRSKIKTISNVGIKFFAIQISCMLLYTVDNMIITYYFGATEVTPFNIVYKAFNMVFSVLSASTVPYWSRTTQALVAGDMAWVKKTIKKIRVIYLFFVGAYVFLAIMFKPLAKLWMGRELNYQTGLIEIMCIYYIVFSFVTITTPFINGTGRINGQLVLSVLMGIANIPLAIYLGVNCNLGVVGIRLGGTLIMLIGAIYYPINLHMILKDIEKNKTYLS